MSEEKYSDKKVETHICLYTEMECTCIMSNFTLDMNIKIHTFSQLEKPKKLTHFNKISKAII
jgi:hypothetical protein